MNFLKSLFNKKDCNLTEAQRRASRINTDSEVPSVVWEKNMSKDLLIDVLTELSKRGSKDGAMTSTEDRAKAVAMYMSEKISDKALFELGICINKKEQRQLLDYILRLETIFSEETRPKRKHGVLSVLLRTIVESSEHLPGSDLERHIGRCVSMLQEWRTDPYAADLVVDIVLNGLNRQLQPYLLFQLCLASSSRFEDLVKAIWKYGRERPEGPPSGGATVNDCVNAAVISLVNFRNPLCRKALEEFDSHPYDLVRRNAKVGLSRLGEPKELDRLIGQLEKVMREAYGVGGIEAVEAARRLGDLRHRKALDVLQWVAKEGRVIDLCDAAEEAIKKIEEKDPIENGLDSPKKEADDTSQAEQTGTPQQRQEQTPAPQAAHTPGERYCGRCSKNVPKGNIICPFCGYGRFI